MKCFIRGDALIPRGSAAQLLILFLAALLTVLVLSGCPQAAGPDKNAGRDEDESGGPDSSWLITATPFMLKGGDAVNNVKLTWPKRAGINRYEIYRDGVLAGRASGDAFDDYDLAPDQSYHYQVKGFLGKSLKAVSAETSAAAFTPPGSGPHWTYKNSTGTRTTHISSPAGPGGYLFGDTYYDFGYTASSGTVRLRGRTSADGFTWSAWTDLASIGTYVDPATGTPHENSGAKLEAVGWRKLENKVVMNAHREPASGYALGHLLLASFYPEDPPRAEVSFDGRPFGCDSRDQSAFVDDDGTAYILSSGLGDTYIFRLNEDWTEPVEFTNTVFVGSYRETPHILRRGDTYFFYGSRQSGWYPSQTEYSFTTDLGGEWAPLAPVGNRVSNGSQFNRVQEFGGERTTYGAWGYRWAANWDGNSREGSNIQRLSVLTINGNFSAAEYFSEINYYEGYGLVGVQPGRYLSLGAPVTITVPGTAQYANPARVSDGGDMSDSGFFRGSEYPYSITIDLGTPSVLTEINLTSHIVGGSETAYSYVYEGSADGETWTELLNGTNNFKPGFTIDEISGAVPYRYLKTTVYGVTNVRNNSSANWAEGIIELAVYGTPQM
jgi:hypothetical protein